MEHRLLDVSVDVDIFNRKNQKVSVNVLIEHLRGNDGHNVTGKVEFVSKVPTAEFQRNGSWPTT